MKTCVNRSLPGRLGVTDKSVLAALPRIGFLTVIITFDVLIECGAAAMKDRVIVGWQREIDCPSSLPDFADCQRGHRQQHTRHRFFFAPISRQHFFTESMSVLVRPDAR